MFAVIVLGIGFIMVAAIFPVAIQQTKTTADETVAAAAARTAATQLEQSVLQIATPANQDRLAFNGATSGTYLPLSGETAPTPAAGVTMTRRGKAISMRDHRITTPA